MATANKRPETSLNSVDIKPAAAGLGLALEHFARGGPSSLDPIGAAWTPAEARRQAPERPVAPVFGGPSRHGARSMISVS